MPKIDTAVLPKFYVLRSDKRGYYEGPLCQISGFLSKEEAESVARHQNLLHPKCQWRVLETRPKQN